MKFPSILFLAVGLAMDATAVAAARGMAVSSVRTNQVLSVALFFGGFQAAMPVIGWAIGARIGPYVEAWDHWIAFVLLVAIGGKMLWEARSSTNDEALTESRRAERDASLFSPKVMVVLAIATSIDALAAGLTLPLLEAPLVLSIVTIGVTTALLSALGLFAGRRFGAVLGRRLDAAGGLVLIGLGTKILLEHLKV